MADLEAGKKISGNHVVIGPHSAYYGATIFTYTQAKNAPKKKIDENLSIGQTYYPVMAPTNPSAKKIEELKKQYQDPNDIPEEELIAIPTQFVLVVRTTRFKKVGEIPTSVLQTDQQVQGMILNHSKLPSDEAKLLRERFPTMNMDQVIILEEEPGRRNAVVRTPRIALGIVIAISGIGIACTIALWSMFRSESPPVRSSRRRR